METFLNSQFFGGFFSSEHWRQVRERYCQLLAQLVSSKSLGLRPKSKPDASILSLEMFSLPCPPPAWDTRLKSQNLYILHMHRPTDRLGHTQMQWAWKENWVGPCTSASVHVLAYQLGVEGVWGSSSQFLKGKPGVLPLRMVAGARADGCWWGSLSIIGTWNATRKDGSKSLVKLESFC